MGIFSKTSGSVTHNCKGHSKSTFVEDGRGRSLKREQKLTGEGGLPCVYVRFFKGNAEIFKIKFYSYSPAVRTDHNED